MDVYFGKSTSNIIAIVAILVCFYAFAGEKKTFTTADEKEYCSMTVRTNGYPNLTLTFSNGKKEEINMPYNKYDMWVTVPAMQKLEELSKDGWVLTETLMMNDANSQYILERNK